MQSVSKLGNSATEKFCSAPWGRLALKHRSTACRVRFFLRRWLVGLVCIPCLPQRPARAMLQRRCSHWHCTTCIICSTLARARSLSGLPLRILESDVTEGTARSRLTGNTAEMPPEAPLHTSEGCDHGELPMTSEDWQERLWETALFKRPGHPA